MYDVLRFGRIKPILVAAFARITHLDSKCLALTSCEMQFFDAGAVHVRL